MSLTAWTHIKIPEHLEGTPGNHLVLVLLLKHDQLELAAQDHVLFRFQRSPRRETAKSLGNLLNHLPLFDVFFVCLLVLSFKPLIKSLFVHFCYIHKSCVYCQHSALAVLWTLVTQHSKNSGNLYTSNWKQKTLSTLIHALRHSNRSPCKIQFNLFPTSFLEHHMDWSVFHHKIQGR